MFETSGDERFSVSSFASFVRAPMAAWKPVVTRRLDERWLYLYARNERQQVGGARGSYRSRGQFCAFDTAQGRAVRDFYTDFANEVV